MPINFGSNIYIFSIIKNFCPIIALGQTAVGAKIGQKKFLTKNKKNKGK